MLVLLDHTRLSRFFMSGFVTRLLKNGPLLFQRTIKQVPARGIRLLTFLTLALCTLFSCSVWAVPTERGFQIRLDSLTPENLDELSNNWKINVVRVQIGDDARMDGLEGSDYDELMESLFDTLDAKLPLLEARGIKLIFCLYSPPGGFQTREAPSHYAMFTRADLQAHFIRIWRTIATRYGSNPTVTAFDLVNEPAMRKALLAPGVKDWGGLVVDTVSAIRAIAPTKTIVIKSLYGDPNKLNALPLIPDANVHYAYNSYLFHNYQDSGVNFPAFSIPRPSDATILKKVRRVLSPFFLKVYKQVAAHKLPSSAYPPKLVVGEATVSACAVEPGSFFQGLLGALETDESAKGDALRKKALRRWKKARRTNKRLPKPTFKAEDFVLDVQHAGYAVHAYAEFYAWDPRYACSSSGEFYLSPTETEQAIVLKSFFSRNR